MRRIMSSLPRDAGKWSEPGGQRTFYPDDVCAINAEQQ